MNNLDASYLTIRPGYMELYFENVKYNIQSSKNTEHEAMMIIINELQT